VHTSIFTLNSPHLQERSSAKRKELFRVVQADKFAEKAKLAVGKAKHVIGRTKQLVIDMPIRWSSTFIMLHRADQLKDVSIHISAITYNSNFLIPVCGHFRFPHGS
jgi:hypothetical protein